MITQVQKKNTEKNATDSKSVSAESYLRILLNNKKLKGKKFIKRQQIGEYEVDFYCPEEKIALILDGDDMYTAFKDEADFDRNNYLKSQNIRVIQVDKNTVIKNSRELIEKIAGEFSN